MQEQPISDPDLLADEPPRRVATVFAGIVRTARPRQWLKNLLVLAAPLAAGVLVDGGSLWRIAVAFASFCLAASGVYLLNDALDVHADREHPTKRMRPIAAGIVPIRLAYAVAIALMALAVAAAALVGWPLAVVVGVYLLLQVAYCVWLKHVAVIDIVIVSSGFLLRAIAGGVAVGVPLSHWFLLVAAFGSMLMVGGKRYAELVGAHDGARSRRSLKQYTDTYLRFVWQSAATIVILVYGMWAVTGGQYGTNTLLAYTLVPFVIAILRYCQHIDAGDAEAPEDIALHDRLLQVLALVWVLTLVAVLYLPLG
ncbi:MULTISPECIES: decaprenyl-phosphate phosphoribosyltransferase [Microbacterium]|uniref:decaprenyl-phosphate phosphoribosyltransferase n=1 Tax=Microbacterium TaxID=33882 RepID=UPI00249F6ACC|nr:MULTISPECIES: decaprenyl-phosphate phosphoribosyltransferase [Microbacterium]